MITVLYLVINWDYPVAIFDSLEKAKAFCMKRERPEDFSISLMEVNKEEYEWICFWHYETTTKSWM
jgi:hypothetical protein